MPTPAAFEAFEAKWLARLRDGAMAAFYHGPTPTGAGIHTAIADAFVAERGLKPIGFNWELLDAGADFGEPRSALGELTKALSDDIAQPGRVWLGRDAAEQCARDFLALFAPASRTVVSNRYDGLWNPISGAPVEWGFVGFDNNMTALLLIAKR